MPRVNRLLRLINAAMASALALSVAAPNRAEAQSSAEEAYRLAQEVGTVQAYEEFIALHPLSSRASDAFLQIVTLTRGSTAEGGSAPSRGIQSFFDDDEGASSAGGSASTESGLDPY